MSKFSFVFGQPMSPEDANAAYDAWLEALESGRFKHGRNSLCSFDPDTGAIEPGMTFEGYKGGTYRFTGSTDIYVDNYGRYTSTEIVGVTEKYGTVVLQTARVGV